MNSDEENNIESGSRHSIKEENRHGTITEHKLKINELSTLFKSNIHTGLSYFEAQTRYDLYGPNALTPPKKKSLW